jgi:endonuclease YncB( thermonuclease family)
MRVLPKLSHALLAALMLLAAQAAFAAEITGRVVGITDGDTLTLLNEARQQVRVRLAEIDTPEARQPYGNRARQVLSDLAFGKMVRVVVQDTDRYGRTVGRIHAGAADVNAEMVRQGAAWVYRQYSRDPSLLRLEAEARAARRGLWALPEAERAAPWEWRAAERGGQRPAAATPVAPQATRLSTAGGFSCGGKRYCREMTTCAEARFYLSQCGLSRLDGDRDGVPCEAICR